MRQGAFRVPQLARNRDRNGITTHHHTAKGAAYFAHRFLRLERSTMEEYVCVTPFTVHVRRIRDGQQQVLVKHIEAGQSLELISFNPWCRSVDMYCGTQIVSIPEEWLKEYLAPLEERIES